MMEYIETEEQKQRHEIMAAFDTVKNNSYLKRLYGDAQMFYIFLEGMRFQKTGEIPKNLLDDEEFSIYPT